MLKYFFKNSDKIPREYAAGLFTPAHIITIAIIFSVLLLYIKIFNNKSDKIKWRFLTVLAFALPCLEISKIIWDMSQGLFRFPDSFPLHLCGLMSIFMPLAVITKNNRLMEFIYVSGCLGGLCAISYPYVNVFPPVHFVYFESMLVHSTIIFIPVLMIKFGFLKPNIKSLPSSFLILILLASGVLIVNIITGLNFFFLMGPAINTPLYYIYPKTGYIGYLAIFISFVLLMWLLLHLPFVCKRDIAKTETQAEPEPVKAE